MPFEFRLPDIGEGVVEGEIVRWLVEAGQQVAEDQPLVEVMTDKATVELPSPVAGRILERHGNEGETVAVGTTLVVIEPEPGAEPPKPAEPVPSAAVAVATPDGEGPAAAPNTVLATPAVRRLARTRGVDLARVVGTGPGGRITAEDVERTAKAVLSAPEPAADFLPYRGLRRKIGSHLSLSKRTAVHYTYVEEADATELSHLRRAYLQGGSERHLTFLPLILKAVASGLRAFPLLNSSLDEEQGRIVLHQAFNIGIATATPEGLVVPVIRAVDTKSVLELAAEIRELTESVRAGKVRVEDLQGGTFTVTSLGPLGGLVATPVINHPEVAILGVHKIQKRPVVRDDRIVIREMMNLSLTCDHRVVDGYEAARFLHHVIRLLESPGLMLLEG
ncbi:MAG: dihydrolipoamide acetyltransferase family protein [Acidobacteriota bacterium]